MKISHDAWKKVQGVEAHWWNRTILRKPFAHNQIVWHQFVLDHFEIKDGTYFKDETLVDIGSAYSGILSHLKAKERIVVDPLSIETLDKELKRIKAPGEAIPLDDNTIDKVFMYNVLQHVRNPIKVLKEGTRILKSGGRFYILEQLNLPIDKTHPHSLKLGLFGGWLEKAEVDLIKGTLKKNSWLHPWQPAKDPSWAKMCLIVEKE